MRIPLTSMVMLLGISGAYFAEITIVPAAVTLALSRVQKNLISDYGAVCNGVADDTAAFLAFRAEFQGNIPVQLNLPGFCTFRPSSGNGSMPFKGIADLVVAGNGSATSGIKNLGGSSQNMRFGGNGQHQDNLHSVRTNDASPGDKCVTLKTAPAVKVLGANNSAKVPATFTASMSGTIMTVTSVASGVIAPGAFVTSLRSDVTSFTAVEPYGTGGTTGVGGTGTYAITISQRRGLGTMTTAPASFTVSGVTTSGVMTVSSVADGMITPGLFVYAQVGQVSAPQAVKSQLTGTSGAPCPDPTCDGTTGTYQMNVGPSVAIGSSSAIGNGQIRLTLDATAGLTSGDTLYLSGINGVGQLPQRMNGLRWIKVIDKTHIDIFLSDYNGGYTSGGSGGGDRTSLFPVGAKVMMTGWVNQAYWGRPYGYPSNPNWFEYKTVVSTNPSTHQVCFDSPLAESYKAAWPQYNTGNQFEVDPGGPATLYVLDPSWDLTHVYKDLTVDNPGFQTTANGRNITYENVVMTGTNCLIPTQNESHTWINVTGLSCQIETDKLVKTWNVTNGSVFKVGIQSSSLETVNVNGFTVVDGWYGSSKYMVMQNFNGPKLTFGGLAYGSSKESTCINCTVTTLADAFTGGDQVNDPRIPWRMSSGVITIPNAYSLANHYEIQTRSLVPGQYIGWRVQGGIQAQVIRFFKILSVTADIDNTYIATTESGGFPVGAWTKLFAFPHPAPRFTANKMSGSNSALAFNECPSGVPIYSCQNFTYAGGATGTTPGFRLTIWGVLDTFTFANKVPYNGTATLTWRIAHFNNWPVMKTDFTQVNYATPPNGQAVLNTKLPSSCGSCTRTLTALGTTNIQTGDIITAPPINAWFGGAAHSGPSFSANTPGDSPQVMIQLRTNQHLP